MDQGLVYKERDFQLPEELRERQKTTPPRKKVLIIAGPTATGKTSLAIKIAEAIGGEIISCDSMQIYQATDIGTAKATLDERRRVRHHLLDICTINQQFNVVDFYRASMEVLQDILLRDKVPIVVGGAGFYMNAFLYGPPKGPPANRELRSRLEDDFEKYGPEMCYEKLKTLDPDYASSITAEDRHKIIRALEIISITGKKVTEIPKPSQEDLSQGFDFRCWFLYYPKEILYERIERRCEEMIESGLVEEVIQLREKGLESNTSAAHSIGYRQCVEYLNSAQTHQDWKHFETTFKKASRNYAKRQFTWFRKEPMFRWLDLSQRSMEQAIEIMIQDFEQN